MESFKESVVNKLKESGLKDSSIKLYIRNLEKLSDEKFNNFNFLKKTDNIMEKINKLSDNTKRAYLIGIVSTLKHYNEYAKLYKIYYKKLMDLVEKIKEDNKENKASDKQKENWIEWKDVEDKIIKLTEEVEDIANKKNITYNDYNDILKLVVLGLYYYLPPRRNTDYSNMYVIKNKKNATDDDKNYIVIDSKNPEFIFNNYKTNKKYGRQTFKIPDKLMDIINIYLKYHPEKKNNKDEINFLVSSNGKPFKDSVNSITRILNSIFEKNIGSSMLRHIYLSSKYNNVSNEQKEDANAMAHSIDTQKEYIKDV
jgi:integrase